MNARTASLHRETLRRPLPVALACLGGLTLLGWAVLLAEAMSRGGGADAFLEALCKPAAILEARGPGEVLSELGVAMGLWTAMSVAMMLPTASAMVLTYADIAETARQQGRRVVSPAVLVAGYLSVWVLASIVGALVQAGITALLAQARLPDTALTILAGVAVGAAGLYQFSNLKLSCLSACRDPFPALAGNFSERPGDVFKLGVNQGVRCFGCCAGLMGVMLAIGAMNLVWMVLFSIVMTVEKMTAKAVVARTVGALLLVLGLALSTSAVGLDALGRFLAAG